MTKSPSLDGEPWVMGWGLLRFDFKHSGAEGQGAALMSVCLFCLFCFQVKVQDTAQMQPP